MIVAVNYKPAYLSGAYNPIIWSFNSDKVSQIDMKYVIDIYKDNVKIIRLKQRPNPNGAGMIDISTIAQGYLDVNNPNNPIVQGETTIDWTNGKLFSSNGTMSAHFYIKVGEEYTIAGNTNIYNGVTNTVGEPAYSIYSNKSGFANLPVEVWPSSAEYRVQQYAMSNFTQDSGAYGINPIDYKCYDHGLGSTVGKLAYPLMLNTLEQDLYLFDKMVLSFINWSPYNTDSQLRTIYAFRYTYKNPAGVVVFTSDQIVTQGTGAGPRLVCGSTIASTLSAEWDIIHVLASPTDALSAAGYTGTPLAGYTLEIQGHALETDVIQSCVVGVPITEKVIINLLEYCETSLYPRVRLSWLNTLGGRDYMNFTSLTEKTTTTTQSKYAQEEMNWSGTTPVPMGLSTPLPPGNLATLGGDKIYNKQAKTEYKIQTDWLTQEQANVLEGLLKSPQVLAYIHTGAAFDDNFPYQVNVKQSSYTTKNIRQNKLTQGTFDIEVTLTEKIQNT